MKVLQRLIPFAMFAASAAVADPGVVVRDSELHSEPFRDAEVVAELSAKSEIEIVERRGGWYRVERAEPPISGWLRMTAVRLQPASEPSQKRSEGNGNGAGKVLNFLTTGRSGSSGVTAATGVRGLDAADVTNATPDRGAVDALDSFSASPDAAAGFANEAGLQERELEYREGDNGDNGSHGGSTDGGPLHGWGSD